MKRVILFLLRRLLFRVRFLLKEAVVEAEMDLKQNKLFKLRESITFLGGGGRLPSDIFISEPSLVYIGHNVFIGSECYFHTDGGLTIGDNTHISRRVTVYTSDHRYKDAVSLPYDSRRVYKAVFIGRNVWIGMNVNITPGVTIGDGAIIGIGATVTRDVGAGKIVGQYPIRELGQRNNQHYIRNEIAMMYGGKNGKFIRGDGESDSKRSLLSGEHNMFFVLGTGRSGTKAMASFLNGMDNVVCYHESRPQLIEISKNYQEGRLSRDEVKSKLISIYNAVYFDVNTCVGESDQKLGNIIGILNEIFPRAKFIWVVRNPKDVIASTYSRGWFNSAEYDYNIKHEIEASESKNLGGVYSFYRLNGGLVGQDYSLDEWRAISTFERNCWYWVYWNNVILDQLKTIPVSQWVKYQLETITGGEVCDFLDLRGNPNVKLEVRNVAHYPLHKEWSDKEIDVYNRVVLPYEKSLYE